MKAFFVGCYVVTKCSYEKAVEQKDAEKKTRIKQQKIFITVHSQASRSFDSADMS